MPPPATPCHTRDPKWNTKDLLWEYLHENPRNHEVYKTIIRPIDTNPSIDPNVRESIEVRNSKIPWNQLNHDFMTTMKSMGIRSVQMACGSRVRLFLQKYMKTCPLKGNPWAHPFYWNPDDKYPLPASGRYDTRTSNLGRIKLEKALI